MACLTRFPFRKNALSPLSNYQVGTLPPSFKTRQCNILGIREVSGATILNSQDFDQAVITESTAYFGFCSRRDNMCGWHHYAKSF